MAATCIGYFDKLYLGYITSPSLVVKAETLSHGDCVSKHYI